MAADRNTLAAVPVVDIGFRVLGDSVPADHGYALFSAVSRVVPEIHGDESVGIHPLEGSPAAERRLALLPATRLRIRIAADRLQVVLPLAGKQLDLDGARLRVGVPEVHSLTAAPSLRSRLVIVKGFTEPEPFTEAVRRQMEALGIVGEVVIPTTRHAVSREGRVSRPAGAPIRRTLLIHGRQVVGFAVEVHGLSSDDSLRLQAVGLGGRRRFGCGIFVPLPTPAVGARP